MAAVTPPPPPPPSPPLPSKPYRPPLPHPPTMARVGDGESHVTNQAHEYVVNGK